MADQETSPGLRKVTLEVTTEQYPGLLLAVAQYLDKGGEQMMLTPSGATNRRAWVGDTAELDARQMLSSVTEDAWPLLWVFVTGGPGRIVAAPDLEKLTGLSEAMVKSYRMLLGKQSWRYGRYMNPISARKVNSETHYYMRGEAQDTFSAVYRWLVEQKGETA
jgi:hypothetical protein